ncbi:TonB-dependent receptor plug domain-containing protein [Dissulfuribacter thermophilus]|nr:TonB-dependent receptor [Dissulfuribacter thermophilus]
MTNMKQGISITFVINFIMILVHVFGVDNSLANDRTELVFVGEDIDVITIASKRAESVKSAPAIASVETENRLKTLGIQTLGEALRLHSGFFTTKREWGTQPFLRGIEEGILFLYDSVPLTSDATKTIHPLDEDLSLFFVKRLELIKGPGSVIWGPDAFAGIVNVVPKRGRDVEGVDAQIVTGVPFGKAQVDFLWGKNKGLWEALIGLSASVTRPNNRDFTIVRFREAGDSNPVPPEQRIGKSNIDDSKNVELIFNFTWKDWLSLSGRWSEMEKNYVLSQTNNDLSWNGQRKSPFRFLKFEAKHPLTNGFTLTVNGYVNELKFHQKEIDISWEQTSRVYYGEVLFEREFSKHLGLITLGAGIRKNFITGAVIGKSFIPDFLQPENELFIPKIDQEDFNTSLKSLFVQVRRHWSKIDAWAGLRVDDHNQYNITWSHNIGLSYHPSFSWYMKFLYGTAFRTPYNQQLLGRTELDPESVNNVSINFHLSPMTIGQSDHTQFEGDLTLFWNRLRHHVKEDPYAGLSNAGHGDIWGIEIGMNLKPSSWFKLWTNATLQHYTGDDDAFKVLDFVFIRSDGTQIPHYTRWNSPFEKGPDVMTRLGITIVPKDGVELSTVLSYDGPWWVTYDKGKLRTKIEDKTTVDVTLHTKGLIPHSDAYIAIKNLLDERNDVPGIYSTYRSPGITVFLGLETRF